MAAGGNRCLFHLDGYRPGSDGGDAGRDPGDGRFPVSHEEDGQTSGVSAHQSRWRRGHYPARGWHHGCPRQDAEEHLQVNRRFSTMVPHNGSARRFITAVLLVGCHACGRPAESPPPAAIQQPTDPQHAGITTPHGDHTPHHGGMVLMKGELHYEVVLDPNGRHSVWFSDAVREDLPASVASKVEMTVS